MKREQPSGKEDGAGRGNNEYRRLFAIWSPPILWSVGIFYLSSLPSSVIRLPSIVLIDKFLHLVVYGVLNILVMRSFQRAGKNRRVLMFAMLYSILFALSDEIHQYFVPGRSADPLDFVADVLGVLTGGLLFIFLSRADTESAL